MAPPLKPPQSRRRTNRSSTRSTITADPDAIVPDMPPIPNIEWHPMTVIWWADLWTSPMAPEYDDSDKHGLYMLAVLMNDYWFAWNHKDRTAIASEIRLQGQRFGISPLDRRRLEWQIEATKDAQARGRKREDRKDPPGPAADKPVGDPRSVFSVVK